MSVTQVQRTARSIKPRIRTSRKDRAVWLYVVPVVAVFLFVFVGPLVFTAWTALHETTYYQIKEFSGLNSFTKLFSDKDLPKQIGTTLAFSLGALAIAVPLGLPLQWS
ncbi:hypothetical protein AHiyo8_09420 [Arthrobacter sp. Hiyo8]|nr:hypothetical protein AHiyo8_09420 [Arthrobacter sp. Hiyo8]